MVELHNYFILWGGGLFFIIIEKIYNLVCFQRLGTGIILYKEL